MGSPVEVRNSTVTLPMTRRLAFSNVTDLLRHDKARVAAFTDSKRAGRPSNTHLGVSSAELSETHEWGYTVQVGIGFPLTIYHLIIDTASAITWCGSASAYTSGSGADTQVPVAVIYPYGSFAGTLWEDRFFIDEDVTIPQMQFGVASSVQNIIVDGVLGLGPTSLGIGALPNSPQETIPTITDRMVQQHHITRPIVGIFFHPIVPNQVTFGELTFGGSNHNMLSSNIGWTGITITAPSSRYWGIDQRISYLDTEILAYTAGIVDSGCTFIYLSIDAYEKYRDATGGTVNPANGLLQISPDQYYTLGTLNFHIGTMTHRLIPNAQIWPRSLNNKINGGDNDIFLVVKSLPTHSGVGFDFINGYVFLQRYYVILDGYQRRVGFAQTRFTRVNNN
ncbi:aspartic peptidase A1 [Suillus decipiens]|nr:aspartic peptidase A1 [Suillus decipiens]